MQHLPQYFLFASLFLRFAFYHVMRRPNPTQAVLQLAAVDRVAVLAVSQVRMDRGIDGVADGTDRSIAHRHVEARRMGTAKGLG
jgi:hypothetical protein